MIYDLIAPIYDEINKELDYGAWADFVQHLVKKELGREPELVLDLACGTGSMTLELASRGYDMIGVDYSTEMLNIATNRAAVLGLRNILWLCQDMRSFELYGTVDVIVSCLDSINHLASPSELDECLALVRNYLAPGGLFIFDVNGRYKFENIYASRTYAMENGNSFCVWQNYYDSKARTCDFYITLFRRERGGRYTRYDETQRERMYTLRALKKHLASFDLEFLGAYSDFAMTPGSDDDERIYIVARCQKQ